MQASKSVKATPARGAQELSFLSKLHISTGGRFCRLNLCFFALSHACVCLMSTAAPSSCEKTAIVSMLLVAVSCFPFLLFISKLIPRKPRPSLVHDMALLLALLLQESICCLVQWLKNLRPPSLRYLKTTVALPAKKKCAHVAEGAGERAAVTILDLPELALDCVLGKLSPVELSSMACGCRALRDMCRSDHLWERHVEEKWANLLGGSAIRAWESAVASMKDSTHWNKPTTSLGPKGWWIYSLSSVPPLSWLMPKFDGSIRCQSSGLPVDSYMKLYLELESGRFWFPAQVYNRENGHVGFMLSCYDAELSYDRKTDTFFARYSPHGRRPVKIEEGVSWNRLRAPPVDTLPYDLHVSDCLNNLKPGDHVEIQWRKNKGLPYGWWYGVVGHLESCDKNELHCACHKIDRITIEFNQYSHGSRWRTASISRAGDPEGEGNENDGFYGGIRKICSQDEISVWRKLWPTEIPEQ